MSPWKSHVKISDLHQAYESGSIDASSLAQSVFDRFSAVENWKHNDKYQEIVGYFQIISEEIKAEISTIDDYDKVLRLLYDWADCDRRMWIDCLP